MKYTKITDFKIHSELHTTKIKAEQNTIQAITLCDNDLNIKHVINIESDPNFDHLLDNQNSMEKFTYFYSIYSPFSQHFPSTFTIADVLYNLDEQYMINQKALIFNDIQIANKIMCTSNPSEQKV